MKRSRLSGSQPDRKPRLFKAESDLTIEKRNHAPVGTGEFLLVVEPAVFSTEGSISPL